MEDIERFLESTGRGLQKAVEEYSPRLASYEVGRVISVEEGIVRVSGLPGVESEELVRFPGGGLGMAFNLDAEEVAVVLLDQFQKISAGETVRRTGMRTSTPVGEELLGRTVDPLGRPLDGGGKIDSSSRRSIEREPPGIMERRPVEDPLQTGILAVDALIPIGKGQRELIVGDRQTGKTALAVDTIINQRDRDLYCIYCAVGQRMSAVAEVAADLKRYGVMDKVIVVAATGDDTPGLNFTAPYAATAMGEYFMDNGKDALVVYDDLTRHARAYRELSLLLRRPPAREAFPGDIFYIHSRLLERATHLLDEKGGGSLTALPIVETQGGNISAYIPTNLISITDGQVLLSSKLYQAGRLPAVEIGRSVSRVGGKTQLPAYRDVSGDLRLSYSQFEELEGFSRFGVNLDQETKQKLKRGRRVRRVLQQPQYDPMEVPFQLALLSAVNDGVFDQVKEEDISGLRASVRSAVREQNRTLAEKIIAGEEISREELEQLTQTVREVIQQRQEQGDAE